MKLRMEALSLKCMHSKTRRHETITTQQVRERCPCCNQHSETPSHFLLGCPAYVVRREIMMLHLTSVLPQLVHDVQADARQWRLLLKGSTLTTSVIAPTTTPPPAAAAAPPPPPAAAQVAAVVGTISPASARAPRPIMTKMFPVADYVVAAWKIRSSALTGREANGGNAMV
jgi:hypothetical protein